MIASLFVIISLLACFSLLRKVFSKISFSDLLALSIIVSIIVSTWLTLIITALFGYTFAITTTLCILTSILYKFFSFKKNDLKNIKINKVFLIFVLAWLTLFCILFNKTLLPRSASGLDTVVYSYGDLALHSTYINYFAEQSKLSLLSPIYSQKLIEYPFLINFHSALLVRTGFSVHWALVTTSILLMTSALLFLYKICFSITKKISTPFFASFFIFLNGGVLGWNLLKDWKHSSQTFFEYLLHLPKDYTLTPEQGIHWANIITTHILPQRAFLIGFVFLLGFLRVWQILWYQHKIPTKQLIFISTLVGLITLFHSYTYLVTAPLLLWLISWKWFKKELSFKESLIGILPALVIGGAQVLYLSTGKHFITQQLGWKTGADNFLLFWINNMGFSVLFLVFAPILFCFFFKKRSFEKIVLVPFLSIFIICNIFIFQPHDWDNMKFFLLSFVFISIISASVVTEYWKNMYSKLLICVFIFASSISGVLSLLFTFQTSYTIVSTQNLQIAEAIKNTTSSDAIFLTSDNHNHLVPMSAGRAVVLGYRGWLWTHGIDYTQTEIDAQRMYNGESASKQLLQKYNINYVFIGPMERSQYNINQVFFENNFEKIYNDEDVSVYKI